MITRNHKKIKEKKIYTLTLTGTVKTQTENRVDVHDLSLSGCHHGHAQAVVLSVDQTCQMTDR